MQYLSVSNKQIVQLQLKKIKIKKKYYVTNTHPLEKFKKYMQKKKKKKTLFYKHTHITTVTLLGYRECVSVWVVQPSFCLLQGATPLFCPVDGPAVNRISFLVGLPIWMSRALLAKQ